MFDVGWQELFLIAVVALVVIGPKDMPRAMRTLAKGLSKLRGLSREFQSGIAEMMREAELDEIRRKVDEAGRTTVKDHLDRMVDPDGQLRRDLDLADAFRPATAPDDRPPAATAPASVYAPPPAAPAAAPSPPSDPPPPNSPPSDPAKA